jgi:hypothetical protein
MIIGCGSGILRVNVSALSVVAGFQVIIGGRIWVITEGRQIGDRRCNMRPQAGSNRRNVRGRRRLW